MSVIEFAEAYSHLEQMIPKSHRAKGVLLDFADWISTRNRELNSVIIPYYREQINVAYSIESYRSAKRRINCLVIASSRTAYNSLGELHLDFFLGKEIDPSFEHIVKEHPWLKSRWLLRGSKLAAVSLDELRGLFRLSTNARFHLSF